MTIQGTQQMGNWGKKIPVNDNVHVTQTNQLSKDGYAAHITTSIPGERVKIHDRFDAGGNFLGTSFGIR